MASPRLFAFRGNHETESIRIDEPECASARSVGRLGEERTTSLFDPSRNFVDVLRGGEHQRESFAFDSIDAFGTVVFVNQQSNYTSPQRNGQQDSFTFVLSIDCEAEDVGVKRETLFEIVYGERRRELASLKGFRLGALSLVGHDSLPVVVIELVSGVFADGRAEFLRCTG
jgi:hypothetical protein